MRRHLIGIVGIVLVAIALVGAAITAIVLARPPSPTTYVPPGMMGRRGRVPRGAVPTSGPNGGYSSLGQQVFLTGVGSSGPIPRTGGIGMMGSGGCATCHGEDGRGGRLGGMMRAGIDVPDIRYSTLTSPHGEEGTTEPGWTDAQIAAAIREGKDPGGGTLSSYMPRWQMSDTDMNALIAYLKELR